LRFSDGSFPNKDIRKLPECIMKTENPVISVCATSVTFKNGILCSQCISVILIVLRIEDDNFLAIVSQFVSFELNLTVTCQVKNGFLKINLD
jgi:hypothetical protein